MRWTRNDKVRELRARSKTVDIAVRTLQGYRDHRSGRNAVTISYYGFISVFPLMLVFTTVLGFVLHNNPKLLADIQDSALAQLPFIGEQITGIATTTYNVPALAAGTYYFQCDIHPNMHGQVDAK